MEVLKLNEYEDFTIGGIIMLTQYEDINIIIVSGSDSTYTEIAAKYLSEYEDNDMLGKEIYVYS